MSTIPQNEIDYQKSHPNETSTGGLAELLIVGFVICETAALLRIWTRRLQKVPLQADDYTLLAAAVLVVGYTTTTLQELAHGFGHHTLAISAYDTKIRQKTGYANNLFYTTAFPMCRISLVLLYKRVFIKEWFRWSCWFLIFCYAGYSISTIFVDAFSATPVAATWDKSITPTHIIDWRMLVTANCAFNVITDLIMLVLPLTVVWMLKTTKLPKIGLTFVFGLGCLNLVASCMRFYHSFVYNNNDLDYSAGPETFWTVTEVYLALLCPCLVTLNPLISRGYRAISSRLSARNSDRLAKFTGVSPNGISSSNTELHPYQRASEGDSVKKPTSSVKSDPFDTEAQAFNEYEKRDLAPPMPAFESNNHVSRDISGADKDGHE